MSRSIFISDTRSFAFFDISLTTPISISYKHRCHKMGVSWILKWENIRSYYTKSVELGIKWTEIYKFLIYQMNMQVEWTKRFYPSALQDSYEFQEDLQFLFSSLLYSFCITV